LHPAVPIALYKWLNHYAFAADAIAAMRVVLLSAPFVGTRIYCFFGRGMNLDRATNCERGVREIGRGPAENVCWVR
jgi:hypothetical protein